MDVGVGFAIALSVLSLCVSLVEVFKDEFGQRLSGEYLKLNYDSQLALCQRTQHDEFVEGFQDCIIVRLRVENTGGRPARHVRLLLTHLETAKAPHADWTIDHGFCPIHLTWMHHGLDASFPYISPGSDYFVDLGILLPADVLPTAVNTRFEPDRFPASEPTFQLFTQLNPMNNSSFLRPGAYRYSFQLLTDRGCRGAGTISISFPERADFSGDPREQIAVTVTRDQRVSGKRLLQRGA